MSDSSDKTGGADSEASKDPVFAQAMSGVQPLAREVRVALQTKRRDSSAEVRREAATRSLAGDGNPLQDWGVEPLDAWYVLDFKRPGVQNGVYRKLKQGRYEAEASLDMHRMIVSVARRELFEFILEAQQLGLRSVIAVHGKGEGRAAAKNSAVLKAYTEVWLRELPMVQAFHSAQPRHGGTGAVYILLQKSEAKKRENRERFSRGRVAPEDAK